MLAILILATSCASTLNAYAGFTGDASTQGAHYVIVPGMDGSGGQYAIQNHILNPSSEEQVIFANTPFPSRIDLGQKYCLRELERAIEPLIESNAVEKIIIYASSQGTATTLNYVAAHPEKIQGIILESVFGSGNSFIFQLDKMKKNRKDRPYQTLPFLSEYKIEFELYQPTGPQGIFSALEISSQIPIILVHAKADPQLNIEDAKAVYYALRSKGNENVYLISLPSDGHIDLLRLPKNRSEIGSINSIFKFHKLPYNEELIVDFDPRILSQYQPSLESTKESYQKLIDNELLVKNHQKEIEIN